MTVFVSKLSPADAQKLGAYLQDGKTLWEVVDSREGWVRLENCRRPGETPLWFSIRDVLGSMRLVRPG